MKRGIIFIILVLFLMGFVAGGITSRATEKNKDSQDGLVQKRNLTEGQIGEIIRDRNRLRIQAQIQAGECPENCTCSGSTIKCRLERGGREMTITAGQSGNVIVQVKGMNASTQVTLYKSGGKVYGIFKNNETREVRVLPDQVREKIREKLLSELEDEEIELDEEGVYRLRARQRVRLFSLIRLRERIRAEIDSETGEILRIRRAWWSFFATNEEPPILGASCGTVSPNSRDECCVNKGYDLWNGEIGECIFSE